MMSTKAGAFFLTTVLFFSSAIQAQITLNHFWSSTVRSGMGVPTYADSLFVDTKVASGLATTRITMVVYPGGYIPYYYSGSQAPAVETRLDSIEMSMNFTLPSDFVADSMWLWVNGQPVEAYIQDRTLAAAQYQQIVGRRRDPALLQYSGYGQYFLRIFPTSSYVSRKIAIQFHHTFDDDTLSSNGTCTRIAAAIPVVFDTADYY